MTTKCHFMFLHLPSLGIIQLPDYYVEAELRAGWLVSVLDAYRAPIYPQNRHLSPKLRLLLNHLGQGLG